MNKSITSGLIVFAMVLSGCSAFRTEIRTQIEIEAPKEVVWHILEDFESYPEWNPYHVEVIPLDEKNKQEVGLGDPYQVYIHKPNGKKLDLKVKILNIEPPDILFWGEGIPGIFSGEHRFILEDLDHNRTLLKHDEVFWGLALPFIPLGPEFIEEGYNLMNKAAKDRAEKLFEIAGS